MAPTSPFSPLKQARLDKDLLLRDVAEKAGCAVSLVSMVENGYMGSESARARIAAAVGASLGSFWSS